MFSLIKKFFGLFSIYVHPIERKLDRLMDRLSQSSNSFKVRRKLIDLIQQNMVVVQLWSERRYKGYRDLGKRKRRTLISRSNQMAQEFKMYFKTLSLERTPSGILRGISQFLHHHKKFNYLESSYFANLLKDPKLKKLIGDCNQMVTLYVFLYAQFFSVKDLKIKIFPGHVCLHYNGMDIETTNGQIMLYRKRRQQIKPIEDLVVVNLLDINDSQVKTHEVLSKTRFRVDLLHFILGTHPKAAQHNLKVGREKEFIKLHKSLGEIKTINQLKQKRSTLLKMKKVAQELKNEEWLHWCEDLLSQIKS